jgi:ATP-binding cassette subfamily F protein 3
MAQDGGVDGFPNHLRVLHVRQEVPSHVSNDLTVMKAVLESDVERNMLIQEEKDIMARLERDDTKATAGLPTEEKRKNLAENADMTGLEADLKRLDTVNARLQVLGSDSAEGRASMILSGLQFTPNMQVAPIASLSGGWRMRVALAGTFGAGIG